MEPNAIMFIGGQPTQNANATQFPPRQQAQGNDPGAEFAKGFMAGVMMVAALSGDKAGCGQQNGNGNQGGCHQGNPFGGLNTVM